MFKNINFNLKKVLTVVFSILLILTLVAGVILVRQRQNTKVGAQGVNLSLTPTTTTVNVGDNYTVDVYIDSKGYSVTGADLKINFNNSVSQLTSVQVGTFLPVVFKPGVVSGNMGQIVLGCDVTQPKVGTGILARLNFKATSAGSNQITFNGQTAISALGQTTNIADAMLGTAVSQNGPTTPPTASPTQTAQPTATATSTSNPTATSTSTSNPTATATSTHTAQPTATATSTSVATTTPTGTGSVKPGDVNRDGRVDIVDIGIIIDNYDATVTNANSKADLNNDNIINIVDIGIVIDHYEF